MAAIGRSDAEEQHPVSWTGAFGQPDQYLVKGYNGSISWGLLFKPMADSSSLSWLFCIDIATL